MSQGMFLAKALYDNIAETPDELAFRRGDVLTVVEQDTSGLEGWWLCSLRGKHGIAPGNRLKILSGMGDGVSLDPNKSGMELYDQPNRSLQDYDVPPSHRGSLDAGSARRASHDKFSAGPRKASLGDDLYDTPPSSKRGSAETACGIYDTPPSSKRASTERTPPHSNRSSASRDSGSNLLSSPGQTPLNNSALRDSGSNLLSSPGQTPLNNSALSLPGLVKRRHSNSSDTCYETPPGSNRSSLERILSEEGPPIYESISPTHSTENLNEPTYDTPPARNYTLSHASPASQSSLHSAASSESLLSNTSGVSSARFSQTTSLPDSARSSMDLPLETYDIPPSAQEADKSRKQLSMDSGLGFYDSPVKSRPSSINSNTLTPSDGLRSSQSSFDCKSTPSPRDIKRSRSLEHALDDLYDTPTNNAPKVTLKKLSGYAGYSSATALNETSGVYDIPPQVMRDSVISMRSDSSDENQRFSSSSLDADQQLNDAPLWDELLLDLDSALEQLTKKQQDVTKATSRLTGFVNTTWRSRSSLEKTLYDIKVSCSLVRNSLSDFVEFAHGTVANALRIPDRNLASRLQKYISPLQNTLDFVQKSFTSLEDMKWQVSLLCEPLDKNKPDDLGQIALVSKEILPEVKKVASFIQSQSVFLFRKATSGDGKKSVASKPPIVPKAGESNGAKVPGYGFGKQKGIQHRPLPAVPGSLPPPTPPATAAPTLSKKSKVSLYDIKAALHQDDYAECGELPSDSAGSGGHVGQEYDYVQLDNRDTLTRSLSSNSVTEPDNKKGGGRDEAQTNGNNTAKSKLETGSITSGVRDLSLDDNGVDMIPVKETAAEANLCKTETGDVAKTESNVGVAAEESSHDNSEDGAVTEFSEDMKTPVNVNNSLSQGSNFIIPSAAVEGGLNCPEPLDPNDRQVLVYYTEQMNSHSTLLGNAVDAFIGVVSSNQPPNVFISHSKFVIVSAHKLVHIGDSIHRNLISNNVSARIMHCANHLCDCLKASVTATKAAALLYPSPPAIQEMVDRVIAVSHAAHELKFVITQAAKQ
ncbi:breast cancer anti-estrogen resistance protein 1-like isoform X2 [Physella acuta]|uniref:breast cancer anti-estrogen resistance protein 1-like isoform X2 n=1 Tax=Physella acuta TaxID=109671 RepID=UPI0027DE8F8C|nr:breast cancer anti-estrogen resistance protein 1-like isoform X2 [Physella acuta]